MNTVTPDTSNGPFDKRAELNELYDDYRTARLNEKYYGWRLASVQRGALYIDVLVAVGTVITFILIGIEVCAAALPPVILPLLAGASALAAVVKPFFCFEKKVERYAKLVGDYGAQTVELKRIVGRTQTQRGLTNELREKIENVRDALGRLVPLDDPRPSRKRLEKLQEEVNKEIPPGRLNWAKEQKAG